MCQTGWLCAGWFRLYGGDSKRMFGLSISSLSRCLFLTRLIFAIMMGYSTLFLNGVMFVDSRRQWRDMVE